jgi:mannonate dehydratase
MKTTRRNFLAATAATVAAAPSLAADERPAPRPGKWQPKLSENLADVAPDTLRWLAQLGCKHVIFQGTDGVDADKKGYWSAGEVRAVKKACEAEGLILESMMIPIDFYLQARLGKPGRDKEIENVVRTIRTAGDEGVPMLEWRFWPDFYWDERVGYYSIEGRGKARLKAFDYSRVKDLPPFAEIGIVSEKEMWERFLYFAMPIVAAAEKAGVRLTMHPNDPPVPVMRGVARIFHHTDGLRRFLKEVPSKSSGITFCQGTIAEMGVKVLEEIRRFGEDGKIFLVHFRAVRGAVPKYTEVFLDEGDLDMLQVMKAYRDAGYSGPIVSDHTPGMEGDTKWGHRGRTFSHGYMRGLIQAVNAL